MKKRMPTEKTKLLFKPILDFREYLADIALLPGKQFSNHEFYGELKKSCLNSFGRKKLSVNRVMYNETSIMTFIRKIDFQLFCDLAELEGAKLTKLRKNQILRETIEHSINLMWGKIYNENYFDLVIENIELYNKVFIVLRLDGDYRFSYLESLKELNKIDEHYEIDDVFLIEVEKYFINKELNAFSDDIVKIKINRL